MDYTTNTELQKVCSIRQPILFNCPPFFENLSIDVIKESLMGRDIKVKDTDDYWIPTNTSVDYITLSYDSFEQLKNTDTRGHFFTEGNSDVIGESTELSSVFSKIDPYLKPYFVVQTKYDIMSGSEKCKTPMRYHKDERKYLIVTNGSINVQLTPWRSRKYLHECKDFENYEFWSPVRISNPQSEYTEDSSKIRFVECIVPMGSVLYLPPYWWYSIEFSKDTMVSIATYNSTMNIIANVPSIGRYYLQFHNTKKRILPIMDSQSEESNEKIVI